MVKKEIDFDDDEYTDSINNKSYLLFYVLYHFVYTNLYGRGDEG